GHRAEGLAHPVGGGKLGAVALAVVETEGVAGAALVAGNGQHGGGVEAAGYQHHGLVGFVGHGGSQWPGWSFHSSLWSCSWRRTGRRSAMIQSARSVGERLPWLGENSTEPTRSTRRYASRRVGAQSESSRPQIANVTSSAALRAAILLYRLRLSSPEPGVFRSGITATRGSTASMGRAPLVSRDTRNPASHNRVSNGRHSGCARGSPPVTVT